jgi:hypothetical protein
MLAGASPSATKRRGRWRKGESGNPAGRKAGSMNRHSVARIVQEAGDQTPLEFLLGVMRNARLPLALRIDAAAKACPFVHARLQATQIISPVSDEPLRVKLIVDGKPQATYINGKLVEESGQPLTGDASEPESPRA